MGEKIPHVTIQFYKNFNPFKLIHPAARESGKEQFGGIKSNG
jgi:hypothetical protein